jgi:hypothetical protein
MGDQRPVKMATTVFVAALSAYSIAAILSFAGSKKPGAVSGAGPVALAVQASLVAGGRTVRALSVLILQVLSQAPA